MLICQMLTLFVLLLFIAPIQSSLNFQMKLHYRNPLGLAVGLVSQSLNDDQHKSALVSHCSNK